MSKQSHYVCMECGSIAPKWMGKCPTCGEWNTFVEEKQEKKGSVQTSPSIPVSLKDVEISSEGRMVIGMKELDGVLGGGIVPGSLVLVGGDPGIGKSTLLLQMAAKLSSKKIKVLYVSGEESASQVKLRADRLRIDEDTIYVLSEYVLENILEAVEKVRPEILIVDSIQTMVTAESSSPTGSVSQIKEVTTALMQLAKSKSIATFIVGHVTKAGNIAGPKLLEHLVDTVLYFEGESESIYRILRGVKNRFGSTNEVGLFLMDEEGLLEVENPSEFFLSGDTKDQPGTVVFPSIEGSRPLFIEVQSLVSYSNLPAPRRTSVGVDYNQMSIAIAILEKKMNITLYNRDVYCNAVGGMKITEPAMSLPMALCIASSYYNKSVSSDTIVFGELGLLGEIRGVPHMKRRLLEAKKLGYKRAITPAIDFQVQGLEILPAGHIKQVFDLLF